MCCLTVSTPAIFVQLGSFALGVAAPDPRCVCSSGPGLPGNYEFFDEVLRKGLRRHPSRLVRIARLVLSIVVPVVALRHILEADSVNLDFVAFNAGRKKLL